MAAIAAVAMGAVEIRQLHAAPGKLEQTAILIQQLTHRSHLPRHRPAHQPNWRPSHSPMVRAMWPCSPRAAAVPDGNSPFGNQSLLSWLTIHQPFSLPVNASSISLLHNLSFTGTLQIGFVTF